mmetsp:Transcript_44307/g.110332  ORF Transcript_44307/g.110332 Transcript_44307/m.110332 type:complete len:83 (-) Transcript_44307:337-585(-)
MSCLQSSLCIPAHTWTPPPMHTHTDVQTDRQTDRSRQTQTDPDRQDPHEGGHRHEQTDRKTQSLTDIYFSQPCGSRSTDVWA